MVYLLFACGRLSESAVLIDVASPETALAPPPYCLDDGQRVILEGWLYQLWLVAYGAPGAASASSTVSFYQLPGVPRTSWFSLGLTAPCSTAHDLDPVCANGVCYQVSCTGKGGGWVNHIENDGDLPDDDVTNLDGWIVERGRLPLTWTDGAASLALEIDVKSLIAPEGADWTVSGAATLDGKLDVSALLPNLFPGVETRIEVTDDVGQVSVDGFSVADWSGQALTSVKSCE